MRKTCAGTCLKDGLTEDISFKNTCKSCMDMLCFDWNNTVMCYRFDLDDSFLDRRGGKNFPPFLLVEEYK